MTKTEFADVGWRVRKVFEIVGRDTIPRAEIERAIGEIDGNREYRKLLWPISEWDKPPTGKEKAAVRSLANAIERVERTLDRHDLQAFLARVQVLGLDSSEDESALRELLKQWRERVNERGNWKLDDLLVERARNVPKPDKAEYAFKHKAATLAASLLESHGLRVTVTRKTSEHPASVFCRVSAALYGKKDADLYYYCRTFQQKRQPKTRNRAGK